MMEDMINLRLFTMILVLLVGCSIDGSLCYQRPKARETLAVPLDDDADELTPQQVIIFFTCYYYYFILLDA